MKLDIGNIQVDKQSQPPGSTVTFVNVEQPKEGEARENVHVTVYVPDADMKTLTKSAKAALNSAIAALD